MLYNNDGVNRGTEQVAHSGLAQIYAGHEAADFFGVPYSDPRYPDVFGRVQVGTVYTTGTKIAEHGGDNPGDRDVPLLVYAPGDGPALDEPLLGGDDPGGTHDPPPPRSGSGRAEGRPGGGHEGPPRHRLAIPLLPGCQPAMVAPRAGSRRRSISSVEIASAHVASAGAAKLVDRSEVLVGEILACGRKPLENYVQ